MKIVVVDSSNIEARVLDYLAGQEDALQVYRDADAGIGPDVYCVLASKFYGRVITTAPADKDERQLGKTIKLACGYQMGVERFQETTRILSGGKLTIDMATAARGVNFYRQTHGMVVQLWNRAESALPVLASGSNDMKYLDPHNLLPLEKGAILLPNGLRLRYPQLSFDTATKWSFQGPYGERNHLYGGKVVEHVVQALAKIAVMDQCLTISRRYRWVMTSHDEGVFCVPDHQAEECLAYSLEVMKKSPPWAPGLPLSAKGDIAVRYGDAK